MYTEYAVVWPRKESSRGAGAEATGSQGRREVIPRRYCISHRSMESVCMVQTKPIVMDYIASGSHPASTPGELCIFIFNFYRRIANHQWIFHCPVYLILWICQWRFVACAGLRHIICFRFGCIHGTHHCRRLPTCIHLATWHVPKHISTVSSRHKKTVISFYAVHPRNSLRTCCLEQSFNIPNRFVSLQRFRETNGRVVNFSPAINS